MLRAGQKLKEERIHKGLSLEDVEKGTRIKKNFLVAIEKSEYTKLPSSSYAHGFVRNYAEFLDLQVNEILALFRREFDERKAYKVLPESMTRGEGVHKRNFRIHTKMLFIIAAILILVSFIAYQFRYAVLNPPLQVDAPIESASTAQDITVSGHSDPNATVTVNNEPVSVDMNGAFTKKISLFPGRTKVIIKATSSFGKETLLQRNIQVKE